MASLIPLRADLLRGDERCLYLGWLRSGQNQELDEDDIEPPVPPSLAWDECGNLPQGQLGGSG
jgi:hypothetical protein